jgi:hypothetical protein
MTNWTSEELAKIDLKGLLEYAIRSKLARTLSNTKSVCEKDGLEFDLTVEDLEPFPLTCPVLDIPINWMSTGGTKNDSPSMDRVIPEKGYTKGNVRLISQKANRLKQNASLTELQAIIRYINESTS